MEIHALPFNKEKSLGDQVSWYRFQVCQLQDSILITISSLVDAHFVYELTMTSENYLEL